MTASRITMGTRKAVSDEISMELIEELMNKEI